jgi:hypothetical protein
MMYNVAFVLHESLFCCCTIGSIIFEKYSINIDTHICMSVYPYEHMHAHPIPMSICERLSRFDLEIYEVGH